MIGSLSVHDYGFGLLCVSAGGLGVLASPVDRQFKGWLLAVVAVVGGAMMMLGGHA